MQSPRTLFHSKQAKQSFWILWVGVLLLILAGISIFNTYLIYVRYNVTHARLANQVIKSVLVAQALPAAELPRMIPALSGEGVRVSLSAKPSSHAQVLQSTHPHELRQYVDQHPTQLHISIPLANGQWLNVRAHRPPYLWLFTGVITSAFILLFAVTFLCIWIVKRLDIPLHVFLQAAQRFGMDVQAPPLALTGSPEIQEVIQAVNEMQNRIRRLLHDRTQMLAAISHDLRTPITRLQLRAEYLRGTDQYEKAVRDLQEMENMIDSILSFARDHVRSENMERFDLNALLETLCNDRVDMGYDVIYESQNERVPYFARIGALKRALGNLIDNAVKYGQRAQVSLKQNNKELQIKISDEGPGIPEDQLEKVFTPFYRVDTARSSEQPGSGLGLAVARDIIRAHGGDIVLFNREPRGLMAVVSLPL